MPTSEKQRATACMVLAMRQGKIKRKLRSAEMMKGMSDEQLKDLCHGEMKEKGG